MSCTYFKAMFSYEIVMLPICCLSSTDASSLILQFKQVFCSTCLSREPKRTPIKTWL
jgi:hypothetical protein